MELKPKWPKIVGGIFLAIIILGAAFYGGERYASERKVINITDSKQLINENFPLFWEAVSILKDNYVSIKNVKDRDLLDGAIKGMLAATGDPYTTYFPPTDAKKFQQELAGSFGGIGAELGFKNSQVVIITPLKKSPAERAGLKAGDSIIKIGPTSTEGFMVDDAIKLIRGEPGTKITLSIYREGWRDTKDFEIVREVIQVPTVDSEIKNGNIGYIHLYNFNNNAPQLFYDASLALLIHGAKGIVLDLRNNPGGYLDAAVNLAGWFVNRGDVVVKEAMRNGDTAERRASGNEAFLKMPVVVVVNGGSASAAEILAGALRDNRGIRLVGERTFGKGSVQDILSLSDNAQVKVTIAKWLTPKGTEIDKKGLAPDVEVKISDEDAKANRDPQLEKAVELMKIMLK